MKLEFTEADFEEANLIHDWLFLPGGVKVTCYSPKKAAALANAKLAEMLKDAKVFYGYKIDSGELTFHEWKPIECTHQALVFNIEELPKACTKCDPVLHKYDVGLAHIDSFKVTCSKCGVELEAIGWKEATR